MSERTFTEGMHLQWFGDPQPEGLAGFGDPPEEEPELIIKSPDELEAERKAEAAKAAPQRVEISAEELARLQALAQRDPTQALNLALEGLAARMPAPVVNVPAPQGQQETDAQYDERIERELLTSGKTAGALREAVQREASRLVGPALQQIVGMTSEQMELVLEAHPEKGPLYKQFRPEIEKELAGMSAVERSLPTARLKAYNAVVQRHRPELDAAAQKTAIEAAVSAKLKELGLEVKDGKAVKAEERPGVVNGTLGGGAAPGGARKTVTVGVKPEDKMRWQAEAETAGVDEDVYIRSKLRQRGVKV